MARSLAGKLLVAPPSLVDPNFAGSVVLVLAHGDEGAFGLVLNRVTRDMVVDLLPSWVEYCQPPKLFGGGPVDVSTAVALVRVDRRKVIGGWTAIQGRVGTVDLRLPPDEIGGVEEARVFVGYSGWSPGQLDGECAIGGWLIVDAEPDDAFDRDPQTLWHRVLGRQRGELRWLANHPPDVVLN